MTIKLYQAKFYRPKCWPKWVLCWLALFEILHFSQWAQILCAGIKCLPNSHQWLVPDQSLYLHSIVAMQSFHANQILTLCWFFFPVPWHYLILLHSTMALLDSTFASTKSKHDNPELLTPHSVNAIKFSALKYLLVLQRLEKPLWDKTM